MSILKNSFTKAIWSISPTTIRDRFVSILRPKGFIPPGWVNFGDLRRKTPISNNYGIERGLSIDRYYTNNFLSAHSMDIKGRTLEIGDNLCTLKYGKDKVTKSDILNLLPETSPKTTILGDLTDAPQIPANSFDCVICIDTLQLIYDVRAAIQTMYRILKPGGVLLAELSGLSFTGDKNWSDYWYWNFTSLSAGRLFKEFFPAENVKVQAYGNVTVTISFLHGIASNELTQEELEYYDPGYQCCITVRAQKPEAEPKDS